MTYTKEDAKRNLDKAVEDLKNNPKCNIPHEELDKRYAALSTDKNLETLAKFLTARNEKLKRRK